MVFRLFAYLLVRLSRLLILGAAAVLFLAYTLPEELLPKTGSESEGNLLSSATDKIMSSGTLAGARELAIGVTEYFTSVDYPSVLKSMKEELTDFFDSERYHADTPSA